MPISFGIPYGRHINSHNPSIISCSNHIFKRPDDWNPHIHQDGYWFVEEAFDYKPPKEVEDFLKAGDKPIYIGFGILSMTCHMKELVEIAVDALRKSGKRGIVSGMGRPMNITNDIFIIDSVPHSWLFEQVAVVCHHGDAGTSAVEFRVGVPSIIIPFSNDQFAWANGAYELGIGSKPIPKRQFTAEALAHAIHFAEQDQITTMPEQQEKRLDLRMVIANVHK